MGGVCTAIVNEDAEQVLKVSEGTNGNEYLITRHSQFVKPLNIINVYGDIESRTPVETIDRKWDEIIEEVAKIEARDEGNIIINNPEVDQKKSI